MREVTKGEDLDCFTLEELIAKGGMATVWKAVDKRSGAVVALKVPYLRYERDPGFSAAFTQEHGLSRTLNHPNIVRTLAPGGPQTRLYLVMEHVEGAPLSALLEEGSPLPVQQAMDIARQACDALEYLNALGIVHRDVKPANILVTRDGSAKILDLGLAHVRQPGRSTPAWLGAGFGTAEYMAPEQVRGSAGDARADVYALGTTLYQMLTGRLPFPNGDMDELLRSKRLNDPMPASVYRPDLDPSIEAIVMKALQRSPRDRYQTASEMLFDLRDPSRVVPMVRPAPVPRRRIDMRLVLAIAAVAAALGLVSGTAMLCYRRGGQSTPAAAALEPQSHPVTAGSPH